MKRLMCTALVLGLLAAALMLPVLAADEPKRLVRLSGWVVDEDGGAKHANVESKEVVLAKVEEGVMLVFFTTKREGTGLGLAICHRIVEQHEGEIELLSTEGEGTTASIRLPLVN